jgi:hypothetical protein
VSANELPLPAKRGEGLLRVIAVALALLALPSFGAGGKSLTLVFEGDNGGEVAPCG